MWHSSVGCWVCYNMLSRETKVFSGVAWPDMGGRGCYNIVSELQFSTLILDGPGKLG
jgi:hypothetical protein